jgi:hypothetical protein
MSNWQLNDLVTDDAGNIYQRFGTDEDHNPWLLLGAPVGTENHKTLPRSVSERNMPDGLMLLSRDGLPPGVEIG